MMAWHPANFDRNKLASELKHRQRKMVGKESAFAALRL
jgi:hypothetical protein